jgi:hypothetical protein
LPDLFASGSSGGTTVSRERVKQKETENVTFKKGNQGIFGDSHMVWHFTTVFSSEITISLFSSMVLRESISFRDCSHIGIVVSITSI